MYNQTVQMETKTLVFIILLVCGASAGAFNVFLTCQPCSSSCSYANCYKLTSDGYSELLCLECTGPINEKLEVDNCTKDYIGEVCSSGFCITKPYIQDCYDSFPTVSLCSISQSISTSCGPCISTPCSTDCYKTLSSISGLTEECRVCPNSTAINMTIYACPNGKDPQGNTCPCCVTLHQHTTPLECSAKDPLFNSTGFISYAKKRTAAENTANTTSTSSGALEKYLCSFAFVALISISVIMMF